jgi:hypothetical protein
LFESLLQKAYYKKPTTKSLLQKAYYKKYTTKSLLKKAYYIWGAPSGVKLEDCRQHRHQVQLRPTELLWLQVLMAREAGELVGRDALNDEAVATGA